MSTPPFVEWTSRTADMVVSPIIAFMAVARVVVLCNLIRWGGRALILVLRLDHVDTSIFLKMFKSSKCRNGFIAFEVIKFDFDTPQSIENTGFLKIAP